MDPQLGTNTFFLYVLLPIFILALAGVVWMVVKMHATAWKKLGFAIAGLFALLGFYGAVLCVYYKASHTFAGTFQFYAYSALAPAGDAFQTPNNNYQQVMVMREVKNKDGVISFLKHPNPDYPAYVYLFAPGKFTYVEVKDDTLTVPAAPLPSTTRTSLWWALTKDLSKLVASAE
ncbi:MAG: hypothetical protein AAB445_03320 [Patescibacteria group bacterium]